MRVAGGGNIRVAADAMSFLGDLAARRNQLDEALEHYRAAATLLDPVDQPATGRLLAQVATLLEQQRRYADAVEQWQRALERRPSDSDVQIGLAGALAQVRQPSAAISVYSSVLVVAPDDARALSGRGQLFADIGRAPSALDDLNRLIRLHPDWLDRPDVRSARGLALAETGRAAIGDAEATAAASEAPRSGQVLLRAAKVARVVGDAPRTVELAQRALAAQEPALPPHQTADAQRLLTSG
jgi:tetratricopeptide (TPR) repeat protein